MSRNLAIEHELFDWCRHPIQYRERSDRMPALTQRFKSPWDYGVPASGRFARGTVLSCDHVGVDPHSTDFSHSLDSGWILRSRSLMLRSGLNDRETVAK